jgi:hypothetical protein
MPRTYAFVPVYFTIETSLNKYPVVGSISCCNGREILLLDTYGSTPVVILVFSSEKDRLLVGTRVINNSLAVPGESMIFSESCEGPHGFTYGTVFALRRTNGSI